MSHRLALIESAYRFDLDEPAFLQNMGKAALPLFPDAEFLMAYSFSQQDQAVTLGHTELIVGDPIILRILDDLYRAFSSNRSYSRFLFSFPPSLMRATQIEENSNIMKRSARMGVHDFTGMLCSNGADSTLVIGTPHRHLVNPTPREQARMRPVAEHLAAAWRLRLRLQQPEISESIEAIFDASGRSLYAKGSARTSSAQEALRRAVLAREQQRSQSNQSSTKYEERFWPELVQGKWTLLDRFESPDKRYLVAYRNSPRPSPLRALSLLEQQILSLAEEGRSNKEISISCELSESVISRRLQRCVQKLGAESIFELARLSSLEEANFFSLGFGPDQLMVLGFEKKEISELEKLSRAEREVAADILRGCSNQEIAARRDRALSTVVNQISAIFTKLNISSRRELRGRLAPR